MSPGNATALKTETRPALEAAPKPPLWRRWDLPTFAVAIVLYASWAALVVFNASIPWPILFVLGGYVLAWHFSLQHEAIHSFRGVPLWLRTAVVWPPIGGWWPYELYRHSHSIHHRDVNLTYPGLDTETVYHKPEDWQRYSKPWRAILMFNQTFVGRLTIGPLLRLRKLFIVEGKLLLAKDFRNVWIWARFFVGLAAILWFVKAVGHMPIWKYYVLFVYPGMSLSLLRAYIEHRWGEHPEERIASVESNWVMGLLFLWNNIHIVHHMDPPLAWYDIPAAYRREREKYLAANGHYVFKGYGEIAGRWLLKPVFVPIHPAGKPAP